MGGTCASRSKKKKKTEDQKPVGWFEITKILLQRCSEKTIPQDKLKWRG